MLLQTVIAGCVVLRIFLEVVPFRHRSAHVGHVFRLLRNSANSSKFPKKIFENSQNSGKFAKILAKNSNNSKIFRLNYWDLRGVRRSALCNLGESFPTSIYLQNLARKDRTNLLACLLRYSQCGLPIFACVPVFFQQFSILLQTRHSIHPCFYRPDTQSIRERVI